MTRHSSRTISLASLAVSISAAALLGASGLAYGDEPEPGCRYSNACSILPYQSPTGYGAVGLCVIGEGAECACGAYVPDPGTMGWQYTEVPYHGDCWSEM